MMHRVVIGFATVLLTLVTIPAAWAQLPHRLVGRTDGLPSTQAHAVLPDRSGRIWIAGPAGVARFDGTHVDVYDMQHGLNSHGARSIALDMAGRVWIGGDAGPNVFDGDGRFVTPVANGVWKHGFVEDMTLDADGRMWLATSLGLVTYTDTAGYSPASVDSLGGVLISAVTLHEGDIWAAGPTIGLWRRSDSGWRHVTEHSSVGPIRTLHSQGSRLFVGSDTGAYEMHAPTQSLHRIGTATQPHRVRNVHMVADELWIGDANGLSIYRFKDNRWQFSRSAVEQVLVNDLTVDAQGNVWAALDNGGIARFSILRDAIAALPRPCPAQVFSIRSTGGGEYLVGGDVCSWRMLEDASQATVLEGLDRLKVWDLAEHNGVLWAATEVGLYRADSDGVFRRNPGQEPLLSVPGRSLDFDGDAVIFGTVRGLGRIENGRAYEWLATDGDSLGYVYTLERDADGTLWIGTLGNGLWRETPAGQLRRDERVARNANVYGIAFDRAGIAHAARGDSIVRLSGPSEELVVRGDEAVIAWSIEFNESGALWAGSSSGLVQYDPRGGDEWLRVSSSAGLPGAEFTTSRSLHVTPGGALLCGLDGGLGIFRPDALRSLTPPIVQMATLDWQQATIATDSAGDTLIDYGNWTLTSRFFAAWFADEQGLEFRHRLVGFDDDWEQHASGDTNVRYTALPPGRYDLQAQARSPLTGWGPATKLASFEVRPPWWNRPPARALWVLLVILAGWVVVKVRVKILVARTEELERRVAARTRELQTAHRQMQELAYKDGLTGLPNQRSFWDYFGTTEARIARHGGSFALALIDLDHFKRINDTYGHRVGDEVLAAAAGIIESTVRTEDFLARYGGEEFALVVGDADDSDVDGLAERVRVAMETTDIVLSGGGIIRVTASVGTARWHGADDRGNALFRRADAALYAAKETRNAVIAWRDTTADQALAVPQSEPVA